MSNYLKQLRRQETAQWLEEHYSKVPYVKAPTLIRRYAGGKGTSYSPAFEVLGRETLNTMKFSISSFEKGCAVIDELLYSGRDIRDVFPVLLNAFVPGSNMESELKKEFDSKESLKKIRLKDHRQTWIEVLQTDTLEDIAHKWRSAVVPK